MCNLSWTPPPTLRDHTSSWTTLEISPKTFVCYPVNKMCSKSNQIRHSVLPGLNLSVKAAPSTAKLEQTFNQSLLSLHSIQYVYAIPYCAFSLSPIASTVFFAVLCWFKMPLFQVSTHISGPPYFIAAHLTSECPMVMVAIV